MASPAQLGRKIYKILEQGCQCCGNSEGALPMDSGRMNEIVGIGREDFALDL